MLSLPLSKFLGVDDLNWLYRFHEIIIGQNTETYNEAIKSGNIKLRTSWIS